jgi:DNA invertase Pin-like site-specific DNA recombinase
VPGRRGDDRIAMCKGKTLRQIDQTASGPSRLDGDGFLDPRVVMLAVLGGLADVERDLIRIRTAEGRNRAKERGQPMDRPPPSTPAQQKEATRRRAQGATLQELADSYDRSISTMRRATRAA